MATIPDTLEIADALSKVDLSSLSGEQINKLSAAVTRLRILHTLGATQAATEAGLRQQVGALIAERDARPPAARLAEVESERDAARARIAELTAPPSVYSVPVVQFRAGLIPLRLALLSAPEQVRAKWAVILPELDVLREVYPREMPVAALLVMAMADKLLIAEEVLALRGGE